MPGSGLVQAIDAWSFSVINHTLRTPAFDLLMPILSDKRAGLLLAGALLPVLFLRCGRHAWPMLTVALCAVAIGDQGATLLKDVVQRVRPCHVLADVYLLSKCTGTFAMPSGHASNMFALAGVAWAARVRCRGAVLALAFAVAYSRVYLGVHYPGDVALGAVWGAALGWTLMRGATRLLPARWLLDGTRPTPELSPASHHAGMP